MPWYFYIVHLIAGLLLANSIPHFVNGISGRPFVSPFGKPPGRGESSAVSNVLWGALNMIAAFVLLWFWPLAWPVDVVDAVIFGLGFFGGAVGTGAMFARRRAEMGRSPP